MHILCHGCPNHFFYSYSFKSYNPIINLVCDKTKTQRGLVIEPENCESDSKDLTLATDKIPLSPHFQVASRYLGRYHTSLYAASDRNVNLFHVD